MSVVWNDSLWQAQVFLQHLSLTAWMLHGRFMPAEVKLLRTVNVRG